MITEKDTIRCEAIFNEDHTHRYLWRQVWNKDKPMACVIMLNPCIADTIITDTTTYLVVNNIARLENYGGVEIVNLFSALTSKLDFRNNTVEELNDKENDKYILKSASECSCIILAWGLGAITNINISDRVTEIINKISEFHEKTFVISDGERHGLHPLTPSIRNRWVLEPVRFHS